VGDAVQLRHEGADGFFVVTSKSPGQLFSLTEPPEDHGRMIAVLIDHVAQHAARLLLVSVAAEAAAAPGISPTPGFQLVAQVEQQARLLVMGQAMKLAPSP